MTHDEVLEYTGIIDHILQTSDLATVSRKKVRKALEQKLGKDLSDQKVRPACPLSATPRPLPPARLSR